jgi:tetratricopeptide (TPR) repeat protein
MNKEITQDVFSDEEIKTILEECEAALINKKKSNSIDLAALIYYQYAANKQLHGYHQAAIADYDKAISLNPKFVAAYIGRGLSEHALGQYNKAIENYNRAIVLEPENAIAYQNRGASRHGLGQYKDAIMDYDYAIGLDPKDALTYNNRAVSKQHLGDYELAIIDYQTAIRLNSKDANIHHNCGECHYYQGQFKEAQEDFSQAIALDSSHLLAYVSRARLHETCGDIDQAQQDIREAINCFVTETYYHYAAHGFAYMKIEDYKNALEDFEMALAMNEKYLFALVNRARVKCLLGDKQGAIQDWQAAKHLPALNAHDYFWHGEAKRKLNQLQEAISDYEQALIIRPFYPEALAQRGLAYYQWGQWQKAHKDWNSLLKIVPQSPIAKDYIMRYPEMSVSSPVTGNSLFLFYSQPNMQQIMPQQVYRHNRTSQ